MAVPIFLIISGYVYGLSYSRKKIETFQQAYQFRMIFPQMIRFTIPYIIAFTIELIGNHLTKRYPNNLEYYISLFVNGGAGPGSYYYPLMMQFIFVFPLIYFIIKSNPKRGLLYCFLFTLIYEVLKTFWGESDSVYRITVFRQISPIAFGCFCFINGKELKKRELLISFLVGFLFIFIVTFLHYQPRIFNKWTNRGIFATLYCIPVFYILLRKVPQLNFPPLKILGEASFNIFLTQMVYFAFMWEHINAVFSSKLFSILVSIVICSAMGVLFWLIEQRLTKRILVICDKVFFPLVVHLARLCE